MCCTNGGGYYVLYHGDTILARGEEYGAIDESAFVIDVSSWGDTSEASSSESEVGDGKDDLAADDVVVDDTAEDGVDGGSDEDGGTNADQNTWWCGVSWDWIEANCDSATPCPGGDAVDCPDGMECFASTPCTLSPTTSPTSFPSYEPSSHPSAIPTRMPWGEEDFVDFLYGESTSGTDGEGDYEGEVNLGNVAAAVVAAVNSTSVEELRYHFFCGTSWTMADVSCSTYCPSGDKGDCPIGEDCYANT